MKRLLTSLALLFFITFAGSSIYAQKYQNGLIDKTVALVGNEMITLSQIESEVQMMRVQGYASDRDLRCEVLENMMTSKLFLNQAKLDSLNVNQEMVNANLNDRLNNVLSQLGGEKAAEEYFGKSLYKLRQEWREIISEQSLVQEMQSNVSGAVQGMTPTQVEQFYKRVPKDSLPIISTQYKMKQIAMYPSKEDAVMLVKERLLEFRERILAGEKFGMLATLYSQDPGSAKRGGELGMTAKGMFWPAFSDAAMSLKVGQVSPIVETPDGFHIIQMIEKEGDMINVRHILLKPEYTTDVKQKAYKRLDSLRTAILNDSISFYLAARYFSEDMASRTNGGIVADESTGSTLFEKDQLKPADYVILKDMKEGDISMPFESTDNEGRSGNPVYKIVQLDKIIPSHTANFKEDFNVLQEVANNNQRMNAIDRFITEKQALTYIVIDPLFRNCDFERKGWIK